MTYESETGHSHQGCGCSRCAAKAKGPATPSGQLLRVVEEALESESADDMDGLEQLGGRIPATAH